jgi:hypothetical protein
MIRITLTFLSLALAAFGQAGVAYVVDPNDPGVAIARDNIQQAASGAATVTTLTPHGYQTGDRINIPGVQQPCEGVSQTGSLRVTVINSLQFTIERQTGASTFAPVRCDHPGAGSSNTFAQIYYNGGVFEAKEMNQLVLGQGRGFKIGGISQSQIPLDAIVRVRWGTRLIDPNHGNKNWFCGNIEDVDLIAKRDFGDGSLYFELPGATGSNPHERSVQCDVLYFPAAWRAMRAYRTIAVTPSPKLIPDAAVTRFAGRSSWLAHSRTKTFLTPFINTLAGLATTAEKLSWLGNEGRGVGSTEEEYRPVMAAVYGRAENNTSWIDQAKFWVLNTTRAMHTGVFYQVDTTSGGFDGSPSDYDKDKRIRYLVIAFSVLFDQFTGGERQEFADQQLNAPQWGACTNPLQIRTSLTKSGNVFTRVNAGDDLTQWAAPGDTLITEGMLGGNQTSMSSTSTVLWANERTISTVTASTITVGSGYTTVGYADPAGSMRFAIARKWTTGMCGQLHKVKFAQGSEYHEAGLSRRGYDLSGNLTGTSLAQELLAGAALCSTDQRACRVLEVASGRWVSYTLPHWRATQNPHVTQYGSGYYLNRAADLYSAIFLLREAGVDLLGTDREWLRRWSTEVVSLYPRNVNRRMRSLGDEPGLTGHLSFESHGWRFFWLEALLRSANIAERTAHQYMLYEAKNLDNEAWTTTGFRSKQAAFVYTLFGDPSDPAATVGQLPTFSSIQSTFMAGAASRTGYNPTDSVVALFAGNKTMDHYTGGGAPGYGGLAIARGGYMLSSPGEGTTTNATTCDTSTDPGASRVCYIGRANDLRFGCDESGANCLEPPDFQAAFTNMLFARKPSTTEGNYMAINLSSQRAAGSHVRELFHTRGSGDKTYLFTYDRATYPSPGTPIRLNVAHIHAGGTGQGPQLQFDATNALMRSAAPVDEAIATKVVSLDGQQLRFYRPGAFNGTAFACVGTTTCSNATRLEFLRVDAMDTGTATVTTAPLTATGADWKAVEIDGAIAVAVNPSGPSPNGSLAAVSATRVVLMNIAPGIYTVSRDGTPFATGRRVEIGENVLTATLPAAGGTISWAATQLFTVAIDQQSLPAAEVGAAYSQMITTTGGTAPIALSLTSGNLPPGLTFTSGVISGTPTTVGTYNFTLSATDANSEVGNQALSITVADALTILNTTLPFGSVNQAISLNLNRSGGNSPFVWSSSGGPSGITVSSAGLISGFRPAVAGAYTLPVSLTSGSGGVASRNLPLLVTGPLSWRWQPAPRANGLDWSGRGTDCQLSVFIDSGRTTLATSSTPSNRLFSVVGLNPATTYWYRATCDSIATTDGVLTTAGLSSTARSAVLRLKFTGDVLVEEGPLGGTLVGRTETCTSPCAITVNATDTRVWSFRYRIGGAWSPLRSF